MITDWTIIDIEAMDTATPLKLDQLPLDILAEICARLNVEDVVRSLTSSNRALRKVLEYEEMWRLLLPVYFSQKGQLRVQRELDSGHFQMAFKTLYSIYVPTARLSQVLEALEHNADQNATVEYCMGRLRRISNLPICPFSLDGSDCSTDLLASNSVANQILHNLRTDEVTPLREPLSVAVRMKYAQCLEILYRRPRSGSLRSNQFLIEYADWSPKEKVFFGKCIYSSVAVVSALIGSTTDLRPVSLRLRDAILPTFLRFISLSSPDVINCSIAISLTGRMTAPQSLMAALPSFALVSSSLVFFDSLVAYSPMLFYLGLAMRHFGRRIPLPADRVSLASLSLSFLPRLALSTLGSALTVQLAVPTVAFALPLGTDFVLNNLARLGLRFWNFFSPRKIQPLKAYIHLTNLFSSRIGPSSSGIARALWLEHSSFGDEWSKFVLKRRKMISQHAPAVANLMKMGRLWGALFGCILAGFEYFGKQQPLGPL